jgi:hypothetical protein
MNKIEDSLSKRLTARAGQVPARAALKRATLDFPSYSRVFHVFPPDFFSASRWGSAPFLTGIFERLPAAAARVAFV